MAIGYISNFPMTTYDVRMINPAINLCSVLYF